MYTKSWSAFDRLVAIVPPGGSIGYVHPAHHRPHLLTTTTKRLDDKLFSFWHLQSDSYPYSHVKGIYRFETGVKVTEFRDLRANPRCLLESQILSFRIKWSRMLATGVIGSPPRKSGGMSQTPPLPSGGNTGGRQGGGSGSGSGSVVPPSLGLLFDPYDHSDLPARVLATGAAANFPSIANLVGDVFNAPVFVPTTQIDSAQVAPHRNAPAQGFPSRATLGCAYVARWVWGKEWGFGGLGVYEDEMKRLMGKRWVATGSVPLRTNINGAIGPSSSAGNSGASTPFGHPGSRSLAATVFREEEEEEEMQIEKRLQGLGLGPGIIGSGYDSTGARTRTHTASTMDTQVSGSSSRLTPSTTFTTPDLGFLAPPSATGNGSNGNGGGNGSGSAPSPTTPTPLTPVVALPTADIEAQMGFAKVAEADVDAFLSYASIVPELCRLETMLIKGIV